VTPRRGLPSPTDAFVDDDPFDAFDALISFPISSDTKMKTQATELQAAENDLKQLMADVTRAWERLRRPSQK
jgi:hypothetical protein